MRVKHHDGNILQDEDWGMGMEESPSSGSLLLIIINILCSYSTATGGHDESPAMPVRDYPCEVPE